MNVPGLGRRSVAPLLNTLLGGGGQLEPGSKVMQIGLDHHTPLQALQTLLDSQESMSVALHEITHFHSLQNSLGHVLTSLGYITSFAAHSIEERLEARKPVKLDDLRSYLYLRHEYTLRLEAWRPLLEGVAVYAQSCFPCTHANEMIAALDTLVRFGQVLWALDPPAFPNPRLSVNALIDQTSQGVLSAGYRAMQAGPRSAVGADTLAVALELNTGGAWLPYFLGHAYVRALHDRLQRVSPNFECPEPFLGLVMRILDASSRRLLRPDTAFDALPTIDRIYGWIEVLEHASLDRLHALSTIERHIDPLWFLLTGEHRIGYLPVTRNLSDDLAILIPGPWSMFTKAMRRELPAIAAQQGDPPLEMDDGEVAGGLATAWMIGTGSLNLSSGGECYLRGWIPRHFDGRHAVALGVADSTWWLSLDDVELATLTHDRAALARLPSMALQPGGEPISSSPYHGLTVNSFVTYTGYGLPRPEWVESGTLHSEFLFEFANSDSVQPSLLTTVAQGPGRAILVPAPEETTRDFHKMSEYFRDLVADAANRGLVGDAASIGLENLAVQFSDTGCDELAKQTRTAIRQEELAVSRQRELWTRRILNGLLGPGVKDRTKRKIIASRMKSVLPTSSALRDLLSRAYSTPCKIEGVNAAELLASMMALNTKALEEIGKPLFALDMNERSAAYLGLWATNIRPAAQHKRPEGLPS